MPRHPEPDLVPAALKRAVVPLPPIPPKKC